MPAKKKEKKGVFKMGLSVLFEEERLFSPSEVPMARDYLSRFLSKCAHRSVLMVSGGLSPMTYESVSFISAATAFISRGVVLEIITGKPKERLLSENPTLLKIAKEKKGGIKIYLYRERPIHHFIVCDEKTLLVQGVHQPGELSEMYFVEDEPKIGRDYVEKFRRLAEVCQEVIIEET